MVRNISVLCSSVVFPEYINPLKTQTSEEKNGKFHTVECERAGTEGMGYFVHLSTVCVDINITLSVTKESKVNQDRGKSNQPVAGIDGLFESFTAVYLPTATSHFFPSSILLLPPFFVFFFLFIPFISRFPTLFGRRRRRIPRVTSAPCSPCWFSRSSSLVECSTSFRFSAFFFSCSLLTFSFLSPLVSFFFFIHASYTFGHCQVHNRDRAKKKIK